MMSKRGGATDGILNAHSGIKFYIYSTAPKESLSGYKKKIEEITQKILSEKKI